MKKCIFFSFFYVKLEHKDVLFDKDLNMFFQKKDKKIDLGQYLKGIVAPYYDKLSENDRSDLLNRITRDEGNKKYVSDGSGQYRIAGEGEKGDTIYEVNALKNFPDITSDEFKSSVYPKDSEKHKEMDSKVKNLVEKFVSNDSKVAKDLKNLLVDSEIEYKVRNDWKYPNGNCAFQKGVKGEKNKIVICIADLDTLNKGDALPQILAHELGHALDFSKRPDSIRCDYMDGSETAADLIGASLLANAGIEERGFSDFMGNDYDEKVKKGQDTKMMYTPDGGYRRENFEKTMSFMRGNKKETSKQVAEQITKLRGISGTTKAPHKPQTVKTNINTLRLYQSKKQNS